MLNSTPLHIWQVAVFSSMYSNLKKLYEAGYLNEMLLCCRVNENYQTPLMILYNPTFTAQIHAHADQQGHEEWRVLSS